MWRGGVWGSEPQTDNHLPQSPFTGQFFRWRHFALPSMSLICLGGQWPPHLKQTCKEYERINIVLCLLAAVLEKGNQRKMFREKTFWICNHCMKGHRSWGKVWSTGNFSMCARSHTRISTVLSSEELECTLGGFNVSNLMGIKRRMIDIGKKITFYFLQNVWKCTVLFAFAFKVCKKWYYDPKNFFLTNINLRMIPIEIPKKV